MCGKTLELARAIRTNHNPLKANHVTILFSQADHTANGQLTQKIAQQWSTQNPGTVFLQEFSASLHIGHYCIDPNSYGLIC